MISFPFVVQQYLDGWPEAEAVLLWHCCQTHTTKIENHVVAGFLSVYLLVLFSDWLTTVQLFCYQIKSWVK